MPASYVVTHNLFPGGGCTQVAPLKTPPLVNKFLGLSAGQVIGGEVFDKIKCNCSNFDAACRGKPHGVSGAPNVVCTSHTSSCNDCCDAYLDWACDQL